jgi:hypothetical protein
MDVSGLLQHTQYAVPVGIVLLCALLVFAFGFKKAEQPPFAHLSGPLSDAERKAQSKRRSKTKEKVSQSLFSQSVDASIGRSLGRSVGRLVS